MARVSSTTHNYENNGHWVVGVIRTQPATSMLANLVDASAGAPSASSWR